MPKKKKPKRNSRVSPALARIAERGMTVQEADVRGFVPGEADLLIAEAMLSGALTFTEIAEETEMAQSTVSTRLKDPVLCAWVARAVHQQIHTRLGMLDAAMFRRALAGNVRAYEALMKRYGQSADAKLTYLNMAAGDCFDQMSDKALDALLARKGVVYVPKESGNIRDATFTSQDEQAEGRERRPEGADHQAPQGLQDGVGPSEETES